MAVPGLSATIATAQSGPLAITFSGDTLVNQNRLMLQAVVDGVVVSDVMLHDLESITVLHRAARSYTFVVLGVGAGTHNVELRAAAVAPNSAWIFGRTTAVASAPEAASAGGMVATGSQSSPMTLTSTSWVDVPALSTNFTTMAGASTVVIDTGAEALIANDTPPHNRGRLFLRALVDGQPARPSDVVFMQGTEKFKAESFSFAVENLAPGFHSVRIQAAVDGGCTAAIGDRFLRVQHARRSGAAFVQPYLAMRPKQRSFTTAVICFDPLRPGEQRPTKAQLQNIFEGGDNGKSARGWWAENSQQRMQLGTVIYLGCEDGNWFVPPPERQGNWYWDNGAFELMWQDALRAADSMIDYHGWDFDKNNTVDPDELLVAIVRPQNSPYGTTRGTSVAVDGQSFPINVHLSDLYLSALPGNRAWGVGTIGHEFSHSLDAALDLYSPCPAEHDAGAFSVMSAHFSATHLDPWHKLKSGFVMPDAIETASWTTQTLTLHAVERGNHEVTVLYDRGRRDREYFIVESRFGLNSSDAPLGNNLVIWHVIEDSTTRHSYPFPSDAICRIPVRFVKALSTIDASQDLVWADGTPAQIRVTLKSAVGESTSVEFAKTPCTPAPITTTCAGKQCGPALDNCGNAVTCPNTCPNPAACGFGVPPNSCGCISNGTPCPFNQCSGTRVDNCGNVFTCDASCGLDGVCPGSGGACRLGFCECRKGPPL